MLMRFCVDIKDTENLQWIGLIVNIICDIIIKTDDIEILRKSLILLKVYVPLCKDVIEQKYLYNYLKEPKTIDHQCYQ